MCCLEKADFIETEQNGGWTTENQGYVDKLIQNFR